jgi:hypothetical protein
VTGVQDSGAVDAAVASVLFNDPTLMSILPDGVYFGVARQGAQRFVAIEIVAHREERLFGGVAWESFRYLVDCVALQTSGADVRAAAFRVNQLLSDHTRLAATGYRITESWRDGEYKHEPTVDPENASVRWQHRIGVYFVKAVPNP